MILNIFGFLVDPTDRYLSPAHRKFSEYFVFVITTIVASVTPLSFLAFGFLIVNQFEGQIHPIVKAVIGTWATIEVIWYIYMQILHRKFGVTTSFPGLSSAERAHYLEKVISHIHDPRETITRWFYTHDPDDVGRSCLEEWICWAFFSKDKEQLEVHERAELASLVHKLLDKFPHLAVQDAEHVKRNPQFMRLHFDKLIVQHKPFVAYAVISIMQFGGFLKLKSLGFKRQNIPGESSLSYWSHIPNLSNQTKDDRPIVIIHGIGIGVTMYLSLIKSVLQNHSNRSIFILELPNISLKVLHSVPSYTQTLEAMDYIFEKHQLKDKNTSFVTHSYGTIVSAWIIKSRPDYIKKLYMIDPVCFSLWEPDLIYNFLYRVPSAPIQRLCQFFVAQDLLVSFTLFRNFWWLQNILFPEDLEHLQDSQVFLSSHDFIIDAKSVHNYLKNRMKKVHMMEGLSHGSFLNSETFTESIVSYL